MYQEQTFHANFGVFFLPKRGVVAPCTPSHSPANSTPTVRVCQTARWRDASGGRVSVRHTPQMHADDGDEGRCVK
eukprot:1127570-Rhodomonas_salina.1